MRQPHKPLLLLLLVPTLALRLAFPIFTHNSVPLCLFLTALFVLLPLYVVTSIFRECLPPALKTLPRHARDHEKQHSSSTGRGNWRKKKWIRVILLFAVVLWWWLWAVDVRPVELTKETSDGKWTWGGGRIFVAVNFWDNEAILPAFFASLLSLSELVGRKNIFVSITENDSRDATRLLLQRYTKTLEKRGLRYELRLDDDLRTFNRSSNPDMPWRSVSDRMDYMAALRNRALDPLYSEEVQYDRILFFNDVLFSPRTALALLETPGEIVCALDFDGGGIYDAWVLKDRCGGDVSSMYPYFWDPRDQEHIRWREPFEVGNCWNGLVSLNARPFLNSSVETYGLGTPLRFPKSRKECYMSECTSLPLALFDVVKTQGPLAVVVPEATVAYSWRWWVWYNVLLRMRAVEWWVYFVERPWGRVWWPYLGPMTRWNGLQVEGEEECVIEKWNRCH